MKNWKAVKGSGAELFVDERGRDRVGEICGEFF